MSLSDFAAKRLHITAQGFNPGLWAARNPPYKWRRRRVLRTSRVIPPGRRHRLPLSDHLSPVTSPAFKILSCSVWPLRGKVGLASEAARHEKTACSRYFSAQAAKVNDAAIKLTVYGAGTDISKTPRP